MKNLTLSVGILFVLAILFAFPGTSRAEIELKEGMTQGDFALWLVDAIGGLSKLPPAAQGEDAIKFLTDQLGIAPEGGWKKDDPMTKELLASLLEKPEEGANMSWDDLVKKVQEHVGAIFDKTKQGVFRVLAATPSQPAGI